MITINEQSTGRVLLTFRDDNNNLIVPTTLQYAITDSVSGVAVVALTSLSPTASTYDLIITAAQNAIIDDTQDTEERVISVVFTYTGGSQATGEYRYLVKHLQVFAPASPPPDGGYDDGGVWT